MERTNTPILSPKMRTGAPVEEDAGKPDTSPAVASGRTSSDAISGKSENVVPGAKDKRWIFQIRSCQHSCGVHCALSHQHQSPRTSCADESQFAEVEIERASLAALRRREKIHYQKSRIMNPKWAIGGQRGWMQKYSRSQ